MQQKKIILASSSPRRAQLLAMLGLVFQTIVPEADESFREENTIEENLKMITEQKARSVCHTPTSKDAFIVAADTIVVLENTVFSKPKDAAQAFDMLTALSGKTHSVLTGLSVVDRARNASTYYLGKTDVTFQTITSEEIQDYLAHGQWTDKAGAYGIQGIGSVLIEKINGCFYNVMGLPVPALYKILRSFGYNLFHPK